MTGRTWLLVTAATAPSLPEHDWFAELQPVPDELAVRDRLAIVSWPDRGVDRRPVLAGTAIVTKLSRETRLLRLRHRVSPVPGHEIAVSALGTRLTAARGWSSKRRPDVLGGPRLIGEQDFALMEDALLEAAHAFGPSAKRPTHRRPRTPGRRVLIAGRASVAGTHGGGAR
jgi:hypothetical protein